MYNSCAGYMIIQEELDQKWHSILSFPTAIITVPFAVTILVTESSLFQLAELMACWMASPEYGCHWLKCICCTSSDTKNIFSVLVVLLPAKKRNA